MLRDPCPAPQLQSLPSLKARLLSGFGAFGARLTRTCLVLCRRAGCPRPRRRSSPLAASSWRSRPRRRPARQPAAPREATAAWLAPPPAPPRRCSARFTYQEAQLSPATPLRFVYLATRRLCALPPPSLTSHTLCVSAHILSHTMHPLYTTPASGPGRAGPAPRHVPPLCLSALPARRCRSLFLPSLPADPCNAICCRGMALHLAACRAWPRLGSGWENCEQGKW